MEIKKVIADGQELEYVSKMEFDEYETNEMPEELENTMNLSEILPMKIDEMEDTIPILEVKDEQ